MILIYTLYCGLEISEEEFNKIERHFKGHDSPIGCSIGLFSKEGKTYVLYNKSGSRIYQSDSMLPEGWIKF